MDDIKLKADSLFQQGVILYHKIRTAGDIRQVTNLWHQSLELYRQIGDIEMVEKLEKYLSAVYKSNLFNNEVDKEVNPNNESIPPLHAGKRFTQWDIFLKIGLFGFGGPMAVFALLEEELVKRRKILTHEDFMEGAVLGDILPGPVTMDIVTYAGYKLDRWKGAIRSTLFFILPSFVIMIILAILYDKFQGVATIGDMFKCLGAAVTALILSVGLRLCEQEIKNYRAVGIFIWAFISSLIFKFDILTIVVLAGLAGILLYLPPPEWWGRKNPPYIPLWKRGKNPPTSPFEKGGKEGDLNS